MGLRLVLIACILKTVVCQSCTFPSTLWGNWTTTNFGTVTIGSGTPSMSTELMLTGATGTIDFNCLYISGTQYVLQSTSTISVFSGTASVYAYICMDLTQASSNAYYYYLNSGTEVGFGGRRMVGLTSDAPAISEVCTSTITAEEFHTMVKVGFENAAIDAVRCPDNLLGEFTFTYEHSDGSTCGNSNTSTINSCNSQNLTTIQVNDTDCSGKFPFFSTSGTLGCLFSIYSSASDTYYTALYNLDSTINPPASYQFSCVASKLDTTDANGTVHVSITPTECSNGTVATTRPSNGALMVLTPNFTCVPTTEDPSYKWLIPVLIVIAFFIILVIVGICLYLRHRKFLKTKAREKKILITEEHPLGEVSISLDAPASLERVGIPFDDTDRSEAFRTPRTKRKSGLSNPLSESSLHLDFKGRSWSTFYNGKTPSSPQALDPFTEMDNGMIVPMTPQSSRAAKSMMNKKQKSFIYEGKAKSMVNGSINKPLPITYGREVYPDFENPDIVETLTARSVKSMKTVYDPNGTVPNKAPSIAARSVKARSIKAPSVKPRSIKALSVKAQSVKASPMNAVSVRPKTNSEKPKSPSKLSRSLTTTKIGSITKRLTSTRKKQLNRSKTVMVPNKNQTESNEQMDDFLAGEMTITKAPSEAGKSRYSQRTGVSNSPSKTPRKKAAARRMTGIPNYFRTINVS